MKPTLRPLLARSAREWETPPELFAVLNRKHQFTLDPAASHDNAKCVRYFTREMDGLSHSWDGERVWLNPPYGREIEAWVDKAAHSECLAVCLLPARTDTGWWHTLVMREASLIQLIRGRVRFVGAVAGAPFPSAIVTFTRPRKRLRFRALERA